MSARFWAREYQRMREDHKNHERPDRVLWFWHTIQHILCGTLYVGRYENECTKRNEPNRNETNVQHIHDIFRRHVASSTLSIWTTSQSSYGSVNGIYSIVQSNRDVQECSLERVMTMHGQLRWVGHRLNEVVCEMIGY